MAEELAGTGFYADIKQDGVYKYFINNEWKASSSGKSVNIIDPSTRTPAYKVQGKL